MEKAVGWRSRSEEQEGQEVKREGRVIREKVKERKDGRER